MNGHGGYRPNTGAKAREFTETELRRIKSMLAEDYPYKTIASRFGTHSRRIKELVEEMQQPKAPQ